jgi:hypothetical protein
MHSWPIAQAPWDACLMTGFTAVVREAQSTDRDDIWPLTREFATSFTAARGAFDDAFDLLVADANTLLHVSVRPGRGSERVPQPAGA